MKIVITKKDVDEAHEFNDIFNCPLAKVMQKALNDPSISVGTVSVGLAVKDKDGNEKYATISPPFEYEDYLKLQKGETQEFVTEYTPI